MQSKYLPPVKSKAITQALDNEDIEQLYDLLTQPLHEALYEKQTFDFFDELSAGQQLLVAYDYLQMQVNQGGFIQFIHNGYVSLLPDLINGLTTIGAIEMAALLDDVLKVFVLNKEYFIEIKTVEQFAKVYEELQEFVILDERFTILYQPTKKQIINYALEHLNEFVELIN